MAASSRGGTAVSALIRGSSRVCPQCARGGIQLSIHRRFYSADAVTGAAASATPPPPPSNPSLSSTTTADALRRPRAPYRIRSGIILTRPPLLTREQTPFESAFYLYQKRLEERLSASFRKAFYFKLDTPAELDWRLKVRERHGVASRDVGRYNPRGRMAWNDEVLVGSPLSDPAVAVDRLVHDAEMRVSEDGEEIPEEDRVRVERPRPRRTEADAAADARRLDRQLDRTLYLVVRRGEEGPWEFPSGDVLTSESLHETASRVLAESAGVNMNTWIVGRIPVAHLVTKPVFKEDSSLQQRGDKIFFLKGRIMAGQADLTNNAHGLTDYKWLTREELQVLLPEAYYKGVRNMMAGR